jgi:hypothetical protein
MNSECSMTDDQTNKRPPLNSESTHSESGAQVLPLRRQLKSLNSTLQRPKKSKFVKAPRPLLKSASSSRSTGIHALQAILLIVALLLTLKNCGTV